VHDFSEIAMRTLLPYMNDFSRRAFVTRAAGTFLGVGLSPLLNPGFALAKPDGDAPAPAPMPRRDSPATACIYIYLTGGMSHIDTLDPKPGSESQGPTQVIDTNVPGIQLGEYLRTLAKHVDKCAIIRSLTTKQGAHERGQYFMHTSYTPLATIRHPGMGAWALKLGPKPVGTMPANILIGGGSNHPGAGFMESRYSPLPLQNPEKGIENSKLPAGVTDALLDRRLGLTDQFDAAFRQRYPQQQVSAYTDFYHDAVQLMRGQDLAAFDLTQEKETLRQAYGSNPLGQGCLLARRLVEHGARFIEINSGGWDTHADNFDRIDDLCDRLDTALAALLADLKSTGLLQKTMVVLATEFGRTPKINDNNGRDHHPRVFSGLIAGGGVKGGTVYGRSDAKGYAVEENGVEVPDFNATIAYGLGLPLDEKIISSSGRPFTVANKGKPITSLFA
jgi:hypothetical protein